MFGSHDVICWCWIQILLHSHAFVFIPGQHAPIHSTFDNMCICLIPFLCSPFSSESIFESYCACWQIISSKPLRSGRKLKDRRPWQTLRLRGWWCVSDFLYIKPNPTFAWKNSFIAVFASDVHSKTNSWPIHISLTHVADTLFWEQTVLPCMVLTWLPTAISEKFCRWLRENCCFDFW